MYSALDPETFKVVSSFGTVATVVSPNDTQVVVAGSFTGNNDYVSFIWEHSDTQVIVGTKMHEHCAYPNKSNLSGIVWEFDASYSGELAKLDDPIVKPSLTVRNSVGEELYATLGFCRPVVVGSAGGNWVGPIILNKWVQRGSETLTWTNATGSGSGARGTDWVIDYIAGVLTPTGSGGIPYDATVTISYKYHVGNHYLIDFDKLYEGENPDTAVYIPVTNVHLIVIPMVPTTHSYAIGPAGSVLTGTFMNYTLTLSNWALSGVTQLPAITPLPAGVFCIAEGFDDEYYRNPKRLLRTLMQLGFSDRIVLYLGASHFYNRKGKAQELVKDYKQLILDTADPLNIAVRQWLKYFIKHALEFGFTDVVYSVSMENLSMPEEWKQRMFDGSPAETGWIPPTNFYSPCNTDVKEYITRVILEGLKIITSEGMDPILQLGEPWWWIQEAFEGSASTQGERYPKPPCIYDDATKRAYLLETGMELPIFKDSYILMNGENTAIATWLKNKLGAYSDFYKETLKTAYPDGQYGVLFFPPSVLDADRTSAFTAIINNPKEYWAGDALDYFQIEDYDWLIFNQMREHAEVYDYPRHQLGQTPDKCDYFTGFVLRAEDAGTLWPRIERAGLLALVHDYKRVVVWAGTQVRRDNYYPPTQAGNTFIRHFNQSKFSTFN